MTVLGKNDSFIYESKCLEFSVNQCLYEELPETNFHVQLFSFITSFIQVKYFQYFYTCSVSQFTLSMDPLFLVMQHAAFTSKGVNYMR